jgi:hypothetical protein
LQNRNFCATDHKCIVVGVATEGHPSEEAHRGAATEGHPYNDAFMVCRTKSTVLQPCCARNFIVSIILKTNAALAGILIKE